MIKDDGKEKVLKSLERKGDLRDFVRERFYCMCIVSRVRGINPMLRVKKG